MSPKANLVLNISCLDQAGIVAAVTDHFSQLNFSIVESSQHQDIFNDRFFMRIEYRHLADQPLDVEQIKQGFSPIAERFQMTWTLHSSAEPVRVLIGVSKLGHCLNSLLNLWKYRTTPLEIVGVFSNHETLRDISEWYGVPFHYLPVDSDNRVAQEQEILNLFKSSGAELLVLARYMQILSDAFCTEVRGQAINIHHSFLPGFKGARPYHQAFEKGVKIVGATAHYVTPDLDEGPIIAQAVMPVTHAHSPDELAEMGRDNEAIVLNRAVLGHAQRKVMINTDKTVVFAD